MVNKVTNEIAIRKFTDVELADLPTFAEAVAAAQEMYGELLLSTELGDGYTKLEDKGALVGRAFLIMDYDFHQGDTGEYVSVRLITERNGRFRISDGSTGICRTLKFQQDSGKPFRPIMVAGGLNISEYDVTDDQGNPVLDNNGNKTRGATYYLSTEIPQA